MVATVVVRMMVAHARTGATLANDGYSAGLAALRAAM
jgi:UDP-N-acetylmuramyl pentapeptide synthase